MKQHLNLLPWKLRCRMLLFKRLWQWSLAWGFLGLAVIALLSAKWHGLTQAQHDLSVWQQRASIVQSIDSKNATLQRQIAGLTARLKKYGHLESEQIGFQLLATISQSSAFCTGNIQVQKLTFKHVQVAETTAPNATAPVPASPAAKAPKMRDVRKLMLNGVAKNNLTVAQFVSSLRDSGAFQTVELKSSLGGTVADVGSQAYQVECSF